jgi:long-subunit fatty acid transport protein
MYDQEGHFMTMDRTGLAGILAALLLSSHQANGNVFDTYGQGAANLAVGNANTAAGRTAYAAYTNPATLTGSDRSEVSSQILFTRAKLRTIPVADSAVRESLHQAKDHSEGASLGIHLKLSDSLHFGLASYLPQGKIGRIRSQSPKETSYLRYDGEEQKPLAFTALAWKFNPYFSLGGGAYYSMRARGSLEVSLDPKASASRLDLDMEPVVVPYVGLLVQQSNWKMGMTHRQAQTSVSTIDSSLAFSTEDATLPFEVRTSLVPFYDPAQTRIGFSIEKEQGTFFGSWEYSQWSSYRPPVLTLTGPDVATLSSETQVEDFGLSDTYAYRIGFAQPLADLGQGRVEARYGYEFHSPAQASYKTSRLLDPLRHALSIGSIFTFHQDESGRRLALEGAYQFSYLGSFRTYDANEAKIRKRAGSSLQTFVGGLNYEL